MEFIRRQTIPALLLLTVIASLGTFLVSRFVAVPYLLRVAPGFQYAADLISLDNFYDEGLNVFQGEERSVTTFAYQVDKISEGVADIENIFDVRTIAGEKIITIQRDYAINQYSWTHNAQGEGQRQGYLFAPRGILKGESFDYWHVNYNLPLTMVFSGEEVVEGITTYRYTSDFKVDQTEDLTHLPGVPTERGVNLDVSLTLWIEPVSGWLVEYTDQAIAYYYDQETGDRIHPWNKFTNRYAKASVIEQVGHAKKLQRQIIWVEYGLPLLILVIGLLLASMRLPTRRNQYIAITSLGVLLLIGVGAMWWITRPVVEGKIVIGISRWVPEGNQVYDENIQGFKDSLEQAGYIEGKNTSYITRTANSDSELQRQIARSFTQENVDLVYSLTTPGTAIMKQHIVNRPIVFSVVTYPEEAGLIRSVTNSGNNLVGTRNWVPIEEQLTVFKEIVPNAQSVGFVHRTGEVNSTIQLEEMREAARQFGIVVEEIDGRDLAELEQALESAPKVDSIYSACDTLVQGEAEEVIINFALSNEIPSFSCNVSGPLKGDLVGVVADFYQIGRLAGEKAALILEGATPASLQTETVARPLIYVNQTTAEYFNIIIPQNILANAAEIIRTP